MNIKNLPKILQTMRNVCSFSEFFSTLTAEDDVVDPLSEYFNINFEYGASKLVLLFHDEDFVIKIPFRYFEIEEGDYGATLMEYEREEIEEEPLIEDFLQPISRASNFYLDTLRHWDYCELETAIYREAVEDELAPYFAEEFLAGFVGNMPIYCQAKVQTYYEGATHYTEEVQEKTTRSCKERGLRVMFDIDWVTDFIQYYGLNEYERLLKFIDQLGLRDFHHGNIGYIDEYPILLDYSDFYEDCGSW